MKRISLPMLAITNPAPKFDLQGQIPKDLVNSGVDLQGCRLMEALRRSLPWQKRR